MTEFSVSNTFTLNINTVAIANEQIQEFQQLTNVFINNSMVILLRNTINEGNYMGLK